MVRLPAIARFLALLVLALAPAMARAQTVSLNPERLPRLRVVDERFQSYNVEMAEVIGGVFWKPYPPARADGSLSAASGSMFEARSPIDLANPR